jgi:hypothetical protein
MHERDFLDWRELHPNDTFFIKPNQERGGIGVTPLAPGAEFVYPLQGRHKFYVAQRGIAGYMLRTGPYAGRKFDLRLYVLVSSLDPLEIWLYREGIARFARATVDNTQALLKAKEVTNTSKGGSAMLLSELLPQLEQEGANIDLLWREIEHVSLMSILSGVGVLESDGLKSTWPGRSQWFQLFGIDVILDEALRPWVLEVNDAPSWRAKGDGVGPMKVKLMQDIAEIVIPCAAVQEFVDRLDPALRQSRFVKMVKRKLIPRFAPPGMRGRDVMTDIRERMSPEERAESLRLVDQVLEDVKRRNITPENMFHMLLFSDGEVRIPADPALSATYERVLDFVRREAEDEGVGDFTEKIIEEFPVPEELINARMPQESSRREQPNA